MKKKNVRFLTEIAFLAIVFFGTLVFKTEIMAWGGDVQAKAIISAKKGSETDLTNAASRLRTINDKLDRKGWTLLFFAIDAENKDSVSLLLSLGANPNSKAEKGEMALAPVHIAIIKDSPEMLVLLKNAGGEFVPFGNGEASEDYACRTGRTNVSKIMRWCESR